MPRQIGVAQNGRRKGKRDGPGCQRRDRRGEAGLSARRILQAFRAQGSPGAIPLSLADASRKECSQEIVAAAKVVAEVGDDS